MHKNQLLACLIVFMICPLFAQDYHPFPDTRIRSYLFSVNDFAPAPFGLQLRQTETISDGELLTTNTSLIYDLDFASGFPCLHETGNWWAEEIVWQEGLIRLRLLDDALITLDTRLKVQELSDTFPVNDNISMTCRLVSMIEDNTAAELDTVKTLELQFYDRHTGSLVPNINNGIIRIGKTSGLIQSPAFNIERFNRNPDFISDEYMLLSSYTVDIIDIMPSYLEFFPFEPGDELHIFEESRSIPSFFVTTQL